MSAKAKAPYLKISLGIVVVLALAIVILNLHRSRMTADPAPGQEGVWNVLTINTAEITYAINYEKIGYAPNLVVLGPAPTTRDCGPEHACLLDNVVACPEGIGQGWCVKSGYRYNIQTSSTEPPYKDYWVTATPIQANPKLKNYCSTEDAVVRIESGAPRNRPYTRDECLAVPPDPNGYHP